MYVIEFQKRGLPHAHILLILDSASKPTTPEIIDRIVSAELPDKDVEPELYKIVSTNMVHACSKSRCMKDGPCTKRYPKTFNDSTTMDKNGYPDYRRRDDGKFLIKGGVRVDNRNIVPHNRYLSLRYNCHINVEVCTTITAVKYLFKYVYKGHDRASISVASADVDPDEIKRFLDARYVSSCEGEGFS